MTHPTGCPNCGESRPDWLTRTDGESVVCESCHKESHASGHAYAFEPRPGEDRDGYAERTAWVDARYKQATETPWRYKG